MKRPVIFAVLAGAVCLFLVGVWTGRRSAGGGSATAAGKKSSTGSTRCIPPYKADKPGIAPDCGMQLEPVYEDGSTGDGKPFRPAPRR